MTRTDVKPAVDPLPGGRGPRVRTCTPIMILRMTRPPTRAASNNWRQFVLSLAVSAVEAAGREAILRRELDVCTLARGRFGVPARQVFRRGALYGNARPRACEAH